MRGMWASALFVVASFGFAEPQPEGFSPAEQVAFLTASQRTVEEQWNHAVDQPGQKGDAIRRLGRVVGESRKRQMELSLWIRDTKDANPETALRMVQLSGLFDAYTASVLIALQDDSARSARLADELEKRFLEVKQAIAPR